MDQQQLTEVLRLHKMWLNGETGGVRANLRRANLRGADLMSADLTGANLSSANLSIANLRGADLSIANLRGADLRGANLRGADLTGANLSSANLSIANLRGADLRGANLSGADLTGANLSGAVHAWSQVAFMGHGECGRMLTAVVFRYGDAAVYQCGCFCGSADELRQYIEQGEERYKPSRMRAFEVATELLNFPKP